MNYCETAGCCRRSNSIANLIGWLSVCMLAAAWGSSLGPDWSVSWMQWGAFGLVAAFGLSIGDRIRTAQHHRAAEREATHRIEQRLDVVDRFEHNARPLTACMP